MRPTNVLVVAFVAGCSPESHRATASLPYGGEVEMSVRGMWSLQSDWHRSLLVSGPKGSEEIELQTDTGWWRGSNLYAHKSGVYVLHEGQGGCIYFTISPPAFVSGNGISCEKSGGPVRLEPPLAHVAGAEVSKSQFYADLFYIGHFEETSEELRRVRFVDAAEQPEIELPDTM
ncbi:hypothetical protein [Paracoccus sp. 22332]|uniref:hypothetical protein n=1 Tax=Paracoccus sp. 22332 TaxID=3453913 RepID=UPI003F867470